jgi:RND family efflux transporter MFP subunit
MTVRMANSGSVARRCAWFVMLVAVAACQRAAPPEPEVRPVRTVTVLSGAAGENNAYTAEIRARHESDLSFQVGGKIISRQVDAGASVKADAVLARLDDHDQQIAVQSARAAFVGADAELSRARTDEARYRDLLERGLTTQATYVAQQTATKTAQSHLEQARGQLQLSQQQLAYTTLHANANGVITRVYAEVGTVVAPGQKIMNLAQPSELEAVFDVSESRVEDVRGNPSVQITLQSVKAPVLAGRVREVSPSADPVTRTYQVKTTILSPPPTLQLGMTATVTLPRRFGNAPLVSIPSSALFQKGSEPAVWVVKADNTLELRPIKVERYESDKVLVTSGLNTGDRIVTAGVHKLAAGQKVRLLGETPR